VTYTTGLTAISTRTVLIELATWCLLSRSTTEENPFLAVACGRAHCRQPGAPMRKCNTSEYLPVPVAANIGAIR